MTAGDQNKSLGGTLSLSLHDWRVSFDTNIRHIEETRHNMTKNLEAGQCRLDKEHDIS